jgi:hypothetical protein
MQGGRAVAGLLPGSLYSIIRFNEIDERKRYVHPEPICMALSLLSLVSTFPLPPLFRERDKNRNPAGGI